jgi:hypothetical protein
MIEAASWGCESAHWAIADKLVRLGQSFDDLHDPLFIEWPEPCIPRSTPYEMYGEPNLVAHDPFYIDFIARIVELNECGFLIISYNCWVSIADSNRIPRLWRNRTTTSSRLPTG